MGCVAPGGKEIICIECDYKVLVVSEDSRRVEIYVFQHGRKNKNPSAATTFVTAYINTFKLIIISFCNCLVIADIFLTQSICLPVPLAARSKAWVYGRSPAAIMGKIPPGGIDVCLL